MAFLFSFQLLAISSIDLCLVFSRRGSNKINKAGINKNTHNNETKIPFARTSPTSKPIEKLININATRPAIVVKDDDETGANDEERTFVIASFLLSPFAFCSL